MGKDSEPKSPWDELQRSRAVQRQGRRRTAIQIAGAALLILTGLTAAVLIWPDVLTLSLAALFAEEPARPPRGEKSFPTSTNRVEGQSGSPDSPAGAFSFFNNDFGSDHLARLEANLGGSSIPSLQVTPPDQQKGPRRIEYKVSGSGQAHEYAVGKASVSQTQIVGAANEWQVRPWWKPGWLPASADCGEIGTAAVAGHVSWAGRPGPFNDLGAMIRGDQIRCQAATGRWFTYEVTEVVRIEYSETDYYWRPLEPRTAELSLFSCTPEISGIIVVRARLHEENGSFN